jgi:hypothetical protein
MINASLICPNFNLPGFGLSGMWIAARRASMFFPRPNLLYRSSRAKSDLIHSYKYSYGMFSLDFALM